MELRGVTVGDLGGRIVDPDESATNGAA